MKLYLHYEEPEDVSVHKTLKLTLPKSWRNGPTLKILEQFVESYNQASSLHVGASLLDSSQYHLALFRVTSTAPAQERTTTASGNKLEGMFDPIPYDAIACKALTDHSHVYVRLGPSQSMLELGKSYEDTSAAAAVESSKSPADLADSSANSAEALLVRCTNFGCKVRFPKGSLVTPKPCIHHSGPPVFHETAKFWSCCPHKRAYDWYR